ncbi:hypothetical protein TNCV_4621751 [Trichonephila clavipes]|nr:hypothetical protein TNCV_4621751 [Trichonephila clavipes]
MHNATVQQPPTTVPPNSNPTIVMLQAEARFVSKHNDVPFHCSCPYHWLVKRPCFPVKGKRSNGRLADIPLCCKRSRMVRVDTE